MEIVQVVFFGVLIGGMITFLGIFLQQRYSSVRRRLQANPHQNTDLLRPQREDKPAFISANLAEKLEKKFDLRKDGATTKRLQAKLIRAGIYTERAIPLFLGVKLGGLLVLPILVLFLLWGNTNQRGLLMGIPIALCSLGYVLPDLILSRMISSRQQKIRESLPDALDLLVVCVEAGQGLDAAIKRVSEELQESSPIISQELLLVNLEIMAGLERQQALKNLGERTGVEQLISLCNILIQSDRLGTSIAQALKTQSDYIRTARRLRLEGLAAKTAVKLLFPMLLFIFPAIMVVVLGPAIIRLSEFFNKGG
ncbi:MAG: type II secretion system protein [Deltaproteobacteria bacterium CG07_land_8_20_14_0_80_60_11]|nr:MAG: type II secretion system protein [Deltaproteobacteria bacterium CG07_land_8_20_14_0_80_60_11]